MKRITLAQVGVGTVGGAVVEQVIACRPVWKRTLGLDVAVGAIIRRSGATVEPEGLSDTGLRQLLGERREGVSSGETSPDSALDQLLSRGPVIVMDAGSDEATASLDAQAIAGGGGAVLSNKAPLALPLDDERSKVLWAASGRTGSLRYEATCGAGLPVISTLRNLLDTGDELLEISGTLSGTFGAIFSDVGSGSRFSDAVRSARDRGYTEPDPRDDLSGLDVARKGLILARTMGEEIDLSDIGVHSLVPAHLQDVGVDEFLDQIGASDMAIDRQTSEALATDTSLKYLMHWERGSPVQVGLRQVPRSTVLGSLQGPENIVSFRTVRYNQYPCVVSGPGAGAEVTAAGMIADLLDLSLRLAR
ncbi:MAG TPA: hypothetical protein VD767_11215 [Thermomicrobiales bacterium]|nr:hypothetical protein [Thermomicrobiales bacterium]